jgi:hypothetical protein
MEAYYRDGSGVDHMITRRKCLASPLPRRPAANPGVHVSLARKFTDQMCWSKIAKLPRMLSLDAVGFVFLFVHLPSSDRVKELCQPLFLALTEGPIGWLCLISDINKSMENTRNIYK